MHNRNQEKRQFERIPRKVQMALSPFEETDENVVPDKAVSMDISENGVCILSDVRYQVGSLFTVEISLDGWQLFLRTVLRRDDESEIKPLTAVGRIVWSQKLPGSDAIQTGVQFTRFKPEDFKAFRKYLHIIRESLKDTTSRS